MGLFYQGKNSAIKNKHFFIVYFWKTNFKTTLILYGYLRKILYGYLHNKNLIIHSHCKNANVDLNHFSSKISNAFPLHIFFAVEVNYETLEQKFGDGNLETFSLLVNQNKRQKIYIYSWFFLPERFSNLQVIIDFSKFSKMFSENLENAKNKKSKKLSIIFSYTFDLVILFLKSFWISLYFHLEFHSIFLRDNNPISWDNFLFRNLKIAFSQIIILIKFLQLNHY